MKVFLKALGRTALRLTPETVAIFAIIFVLPAMGHPYPWLTVLVLGVGLPRAWRAMRMQQYRAAREYGD